MTDTTDCITGITVPTLPTSQRALMAIGLSLTSCCINRRYVFGGCSFLKITPKVFEMEFNMEFNNVLLNYV